MCNPMPTQATGGGRQNTSGTSRALIDELVLITAWPRSVYFCFGGKRRLDLIVLAHRFPSEARVFCCVLHVVPTVVCFEAQ